MVTSIGLADKGHLPQSSLREENIDIGSKTHPMKTNHHSALALDLEAFLLLIRAMDKGCQYNLQLFTFFHALCSSSNTDYRLHRDALQLYPENHFLHVTMLERLATAIAFRLLREGDPQSALPILLFPIYSPCPPNLSIPILVLTSAIKTRWERLRDLRDLEDYIRYGRLALARISPSFINGAVLRVALAGPLIELSRKTKDVTHIDQAIDYLQQSEPFLSSSQKTHLRVPYYFLNAFLARYLVFYDPADLQKATPHLIDVMANHHFPTRIQDLLDFFLNLHHWRNVGITSHLDPAISCMEDLIPQLPPEAEGERLAIFAQLADAYIFRFHNTRSKEPGGTSDLDYHILHTTNALRHQPPGTPVYQLRLIRVSQAYTRRYVLTKVQQDLDDAIEYGDAAVTLLSSIPSDSYTLTQVSHMLTNQFRQTYDLSTLDNAIGLARSAVETSSPEQALECADAFIALSDALEVRFDCFGTIADLDESIEYLRKAVELIPSKHVMLGNTLEKLSIKLERRFITLKHRGDNQEGLEYSSCRESSIPLHLREAERIMSRMVTSRALPTKGSLDTMVQLSEQQLESDEDIVISHYIATWTLAGSLAMRGMSEKNLEDLDKAIELLHTLKRTDARFIDGVFLETLATSYLMRFKLRGEISDLEGAISTCLYVMSSFPERSYGMSKILIVLANAYVARGCILLQPFDFEKALVLYKKAASAPTYSPMERLDGAREWAKIARGISHESVLQAYTSALSLLDNFVTSSRTVEGRYLKLAEKGGSLPEQAASLAISKNLPETAIEFLEQGRAILWSQVGRYRTPVDRLEETNPSLAEDFRQISALLEEKSVANSTSLGGFDPPVYRSYSQRWDAVVEKIRAEEGFSNFLKQTPFATLQKAALNGPVIVINIDSFHSDAIIVRNDYPPIVVPVPEATPHAIGSLVVGLFKALHTLRANGESSLDNPGIKRTITNTLQRMWSILVGPIVEILSDECHLAQGSRVWWCPTGILWSFPIHAAGPYQPGKRNLPDIFVSSYTPTLSALLQSIKIRTGEASRAPMNMLVVGQAKTPGQAELPNVLKEIEKVRENCPSAWLLEEAAATRHAVVCGLQQYSWVHFSCHGKQDRDQPFNSCFVLHNETLSLLDIAQTGMSNADFAFLSACHSAAGDLRRPNEAIHLASGLQFSGFKSVVGTMWAMADIDGPVVANEFYGYMFRNRGGADHQDAAVALNLATKALRRMKVPLERWINFIHIGA